MNICATKTKTETASKTKELVSQATVAENKPKKTST
jgi:hypothetical protein